jgi:preprotein translocase subunit YajC
MKILAITLLQAASATTPAQQPTGAGWSFWIMIILMFVIMWFFMIRPQRKQQKELEAFRNSLKKGDKVVTAGGIFGTVAEINDKTALIKIDGEVKIKVDKASLLRDYSQDAPQQ